MMPSVKKESKSKVEVLSKREVKKRINIRWNSGLFFQIGLIVSMLLVFLVVESNIGFSDLAYIPKTNTHSIDEEPFTHSYRLEDFKPVEAEKPKTIEKVREIVKPILSSQFKQVDNLSNQIENPTATTEVTPDAPIDPAPLIPSGNGVVEKKPIYFVENAPIFPGCEALSSENERRACLDEKINAFIGKKFDIDKFSDKYAGKNNRIDVQFTVDSRGEIVDIKTRSAYEDLGKEAKRVIGSLPKLTPGKHNNQWVEVVYTVPIMLNIEY